MSVPAFADIAKSANDLLNKDFYHLSAGTLEVKSNTPNNVAFKVTGKSSHDQVTSGAIEGKYTDKPLGTATSSPSSFEIQPPVTTTITTSSSAAVNQAQPKQRRRLKNGSASSGRAQRDYQRSRNPDLSFVLYGRGSRVCGHSVDVVAQIAPSNTRMQVLMWYRRPTIGLTLTQSWNTANALESKLELNDSLAKGLKAEGIFSFLPASSARGAKFNLHFKQPNFHGRAFFDLLKGPTANIDAVVGHEGFLAGASAGYDVAKGAVTSYSAAVGYAAPTYSAAVTASDHLSLFAASYYHKVNSQVEAGAKATWNSKASNTVGLEVASKYRLDPLSFVKAKINDRGVAAVAYNVCLRPGVFFGIGASFDTQKLDQASHKVGTSFTFES